MDKTATLNLRVNPTLKADAEAILGQLGLPMSTAVDLFLNQIVLTGGLPFAVSLPAVPAGIDARGMSEEEIREKLRRGYEDYRSGKVQDAASTFSKFRDSHRK